MLYTVVREKYFTNHVVLKYTTNSLDDTCTCITHLFFISNKFAKDAETSASERLKKLT